MFVRPLILLLVTCVLMAACWSERGGMTPDYRVQAIGCLLPIPGSYILNTDSDGGYLFYDSSEANFGLIRIDKYDEADLDDLLLQSEIVAKVETTDRVAMSILWKLEDSTGPDLPVAIIHDYQEIGTGWPGRPLRPYRSSSDVFDKLMNSASFCDK